MPIITDLDTNEIIDITFPKIKFSTYLKKIDIKNTKNISFKEKRLIFLLLITDFKSGKLSLDDLSSISSFLWETEQDKDSDLASALYAAAEFNFYVRKAYVKEASNQFNFFMEDVMKYYEKNKLLIK